MGNSGLFVAAWEVGRCNSLIFEFRRSGSGLWCSKRQVGAQKLRLRPASVCTTGGMLDQELMHSA